MYSESDWYGYISEMKTDFYIKEKDFFNVKCFKYRIKIFFKNLEIRKRIKEIEFQGCKIQINENTIKLSEDLYFPHKNFKTILDIPVNLNKMSNDKTLKIILDDNRIVEKNFNIANSSIKDNRIDVDIIKENNVDSYLCIKSDKCFYVEKSICNHDKITKEVCKYPAHELLVKNNNEVLDVCIYNDVEEKVFILQNRFSNKDYYIYKWETGSLWKDFINATGKHKKMKILFENERIEDIEEMKSILDSKDVCYIFEKI